MFADNDRPRLPESTGVFENGERYVFIVPGKPDWCVANKNFALALSLCNGSNTISDIRTKLNHPQFDDCVAKLNQLEECGYFNNNINYCSEIELSLQDVHLNMTDACNLKCVYCYAEERPVSKGRLLSFGQYHDLIDDLYAINQDMLITFTGGEPLLCPYTLDLAKYCKEKGLKTFLLTNGTLINDENAQEIAKLFDTVRISLDGASAGAHDALRGKGSFEKALNGVRLLEKYHNLPNIAMVVTRLNMRDIPEMASRYGSRLTFQPLYSVGRAKVLDIGLTGEEYYHALKSSDNVGVNFSRTDSIASLRNNGCQRCAIADGELSISPQGDVYPCHMLHADEFCAGNVHLSSITDIYKNSKVLVELRKRTVNDKQECRDCPLRLLCGGGCWARAYYCNGNIDARDSFCEFELISIREALFNAGSSCDMI